MRQRSSKKGFTLLELLVVIAIIGLLASVVLASLNTARERARDARRIADLRQMQIALELYYYTNNAYPSSGWHYSYNTTWNTLQSALAPYMPSLPVDPTNSSGAPWSVGGSGYAYAYQPTQSGQSYELVTRLETPDHPQSCGVMNHRRTYSSYLGQSWCLAFGGSLDNQIYAISP